MILRKHKDDSEMIEIISERSGSRYGNHIVWGVVHADILGELLEQWEIDLFNEQGIIEITAKVKNKE